MVVALLVTGAAMAVWGLFVWKGPQLGPSTDEAWAVRRQQRRAGPYLVALGGIVLAGGVIAALLVA